MIEVGQRLRSNTIMNYDIQIIAEKYHYLYKNILDSR